MSTREVDDRSSEVVYSQPSSGHHWGPNGSSDSYEGTATFTRTRGATARIAFQGVRIQVMGLVPPKGTGNTPVSTYGLDSQPAYQFTATQDSSSTRARVIFYDSGELEPGQHTLIVTNEAEGSYFWVDSFVITENPEPTPDAPSQPPAPVSTPSSVETTPAQDGIPTPVITSDQSLSASSPTPPAVDPSPGEEIASDWQGGVKVIVTTKDSESQPSGVPGSPQLDNAAGSAADGPNVAAIVGGVLGGLVIVLTFILILFVLKRKQKRNAKLYDPSPHPNNVLPFHTGWVPPNGAPIATWAEKSGYVAGSSPMATSDNVAGHGYQPRISVKSNTTSTTGDPYSGYTSTLVDAPPPSYQQTQSDDIGPRLNATS